MRGARICNKVADAAGAFAHAATIACIDRTTVTVHFAAAGTWRICFFDFHAFARAAADAGKANIGEMLAINIGYAFRQASRGNIGRHNCAASVIDARTNHTAVIACQIAAIRVTRAFRIADGGCVGILLSDALPAPANADLATVLRVATRTTETVRTRARR